VRVRHVHSGTTATQDSGEARAGVNLDHTTVRLDGRADATASYRYDHTLRKHKPAGVEIVQRDSSDFGLNQ
jgi:hypothetical protein